MSSLQEKQHLDEPVNNEKNSFVCHFSACCFAGILLTLYIKSFHLNLTATLQGR